MTSSHKKLLSIAILIIIASAFIYYIYAHISDFGQLKLVNPGYIIILILLFLTMSFNNGLINKYLFKPFGINLKFKEYFGLSVVTSFYNLITPFRGGAVVRAVYLKKKHNFSYMNFLATLSGIYVISFFIGSLFGLISMLGIYLLYGLFNWLIFLLFNAIFLVLLGVMIFSPKFRKTKNNFVNKVIRVINGWNLIKNNKKIIFAVSAVTAINLFISSLNLFLEFKLFGIEISFIKTLFLSAISYLSLLISITPGALGIKEALVVFSSKIVGIGVTEAIAVSILDRVILMLIIFILGPIFSYILIKNKPKLKGEQKNGYCEER